MTLVTIGLIGVVMTLTVTSLFLLAVHKQNLGYDFDDHYDQAHRLLDDGEP